MKKVFFILGTLLLSLSTYAAMNVNKIDPPFWYTGMQNPELQLMVYGEGIGNATVSVNYPGVSLSSTVKLESNNYLLVYLRLDKNVKPGKMPLTFTQGKKKFVKEYELKARTKKGCEHKGFDASDALYLLMPDRFANGNPDNDQIAGMAEYKVDRNDPNARHGGDLAGIEQHLDYFSDLGVTALWFTPVLENNMTGGSYHGYATTDYYKVDPRFGSNEEYKQLIEKSHTRGIKIVMDMIFNHCGVEHIWIKDMPCKDWFNNPDHENNFVQTSFKLTPHVDPYASKYDFSQMNDGWFVTAMPDLNQNNPHVYRYLVQNSFWWIEFANIDGIRMDTYPYADYDAMSNWMKELNEEYPNYNTVGETWVTEPAYTAWWQKDSKLSAPKNSNLKTVMDFSFYDKINIAKTEETETCFVSLGIKFFVMAKLHFRPYIPNQTVLFPQRIDENIAATDPVRIVNAVIDNLNLESFKKLYKETGRCPYHPKMMLKVIIYAYMNNIYSCRKIEKHLLRDIHYIWLAGNEHPDFITINRFRNRVKEEINNVFTQLVLVLADKGFISLDVEYIDGTKIESKANKYTFVWRKTVERNRTRLMDKIRILLEQVDETIAQENSIKDTSVEFTSCRLSDIVDELKEALERQPATKDKEEKKALSKKEEAGQGT